MRPDSSAVQIRTPPDILAVSALPVLPVTDGATLRIAEILKGISPRYHIRLVAPAPRVAGEDYATIGVAESIPVELEGRWTYLPNQYTVEPLIEAVRSEIRRRRPSALLLWPGTEFLVADLDDPPPVILDRIDCETLLAWRRLKRARTPRGILAALSHLRVFYQYEKAVARDPAAVMVVGEADARSLSRVSGSPNVHVVPNGVELGPEPDPDRLTENPTVAFTGVMSYPPNIDAASYFATSIWPRVRRAVPDAVFRVIGRSPVPEIIALGELERVEVTGEVPDLREELETSWAAVAPMRKGAGIKNKILEAWAAGAPVVMTPLATNGLYARERFTELVRDRPEDFADRVIRLLTDEGYRRYWSEQAREAARVQSWSSVAESVTSHIESVRLRTED
ncbi:MAG: glycosyltransferase family 4 protein [marine benthic group bacterium]|jgi:glycosyltransferase involved in cell wall biosynthesis|nr:glycosyltransferase family 4 protein [Candidatus Carthagonibacter metallireducens]MCL7978698.1 glycosyltransferase family 4 protein [Gemmatimonadota bacterium]MCL7982432.1 glycosyltransferase family 4 protein [Gemmatimonadota bacterium]MCL7985938.1 glycosyltransferase family 4 protein [Gemmatimonadota bacterium]MCL7991827.1 glycosyltransferase family 4 protein [Gemmatimonadota bacterium]